MADAEPTDQPIYSGCFTQKVDGRRVVIPSRWLPAKLDGNGKPFEFTLVVWPSGNCGTFLRVLPPHQLDRLMKKIEEMPDSDPDKPVRKRYIGSHSMQATVDKQGRMVLPEEMAKAAGIGNEVVLRGCLDRFEMWSVERSAAVETTDSVKASESLAMLG
ncbi:MAG: hypothetical protein HZA90_27260 [Verrucomicrobia bacterium]|nr:hypothetical protein [Verrucomicrobiota bacterium]